MTSFLLFENRSTALRCRFSHHNGHRKLSPVADPVIFCRFSQKWSLRVVRSDRFGDSCALRQKVVRNVVFEMKNDTLSDFSSPRPPKACRHRRARASRKPQRLAFAYRSSTPSKPFQTFLPVYLRGVISPLNTLTAGSANASCSISPG